MKKEIFITNRKGLKLAINLLTDDSFDKLVFLMHGLGARKDYPHMQVMEDIFFKHGFNVVNIDATNSNNNSDKSEEGITFTGHYNDLEDVISWAKTQSFYKEPFALAGHSLGARACVLFASKEPHLVNLLLCLSLPWINQAEKEPLINAIVKNINTFGIFEKNLKLQVKFYKLKNIG